MQSSDATVPATFELGGHVQDQKHAVIAIMGPSGTGKTSFINLVAGKDVGKVGRGLQPGMYSHWLNQ